MGEAEQQILRMLSDGIISADEASQLLRSMKATDEASMDGEIDSQAYQDAIEGEIITPGARQPPRELFQIRRYYTVGTFVAIGSALLSGAGLYLLLQSENPAFLGLFCFLSIFLLSVMVAVLLLFSRGSTWLYLNIEEQSGSRIRFAFPLPLVVVNWFIRAARPFLPAAVIPYLETAAAFVQAVRNDPDKEPILINVDDGTGERVQIFIG